MDKVIVKFRSETISNLVFESRFRSNTISVTSEGNFLAVKERDSKTFIPSDLILKVECYNY